MNTSLKKLKASISWALAMAITCTAGVSHALNTQTGTDLRDLISPYMSTLKTQSIKFDHHGGYLLTPEVTTKCYNTVTQDIRTFYTSGVDVRLMAAPREETIRTAVSGDDWLCTSTATLNAMLGAKYSYTLNRCDNVTLKTKGTTGFPRADITYSNCTEEGPQFYKDCDYKGASKVIGEGDFTVAAIETLGLKNNDISSIRVPAGYEVEYFENDNFTGKSAIASSDIGASCLVKNSFNDKISSFKVRKVGATVFKHCSYGGYSSTLEPGRYTVSDLRAKGIEGSDLSSIRVSAGYEITLFSGSGFTGLTATLTSDNSCLTSINMNDKTNSIIVRKL